MYIYEILKECKVVNAKLIYGVILQKLMLMNMMLNCNYR